MAAKPTPLRLRIILEALVVVAVAVFAVASIADVLIVVVIEVVCLRFFYIGFRLVRFFVTEEKSKSQKKYETMMGLRENYVLDRQRHAACMPLSHFTSYACINLNHNSSFGSGGSVFASFSSSSSEMKKGSFTCSSFTSSWSSTIGLSLESFAIVSANVSTPLRI